MKPGDLDPDMKRRGWTPKAVYTKANVVFRSTAPTVALSLGLDESRCGHLPGGERADALDGASHLPFGVSIGRYMGDPDTVPWEEELIVYAVQNEGEYPLELTATNVSGSDVRVEVDVLPTPSPFIAVSAHPRRVAGTIRAGGSRRYQVAVRASRVAPEPPAPVRDLAAYSDRERITLHWSVVPEQPTTAYTEAARPSSRSRAPTSSTRSRHPRYVLSARRSGPFTLSKLLTRPVPGPGLTRRRARPA